MKMYDNYAPFYDGSGQLRFAILMIQYLGELLKQHPVMGRRALDLACGTGTLALALADQGWEVTGLDASLAMLEIARAKATNIDLSGHVRFVQGDMRDAAARVNSSPARAHTPLTRFDLITCVYDSLNYLVSEADIASCFRSVSALLVAGGVFVVDMNTRHFLEHDWGVYDVLEQPDFVQITQSYFDAETACSTMVLTGFTGDDTHGYQRFDETHVERAYSPETIAALLVDAGLQVEATYDCFTFQPVADLTQRIAWVARKPA